MQGVCKPRPVPADHSPQLDVDRPGRRSSYRSRLSESPGTGPGPGATRGSRSGTRTARPRGPWAATARAGADHPTGASAPPRLAVPGVVTARRGWGRGRGRAGRPEHGAGENLLPGDREHLGVLTKTSTISREPREASKKCLGRMRKKRDFSEKFPRARAQQTRKRARLGDDPSTSAGAFWARRGWAPPRTPSPWRRPARSRPGRDTRLRAGWPGCGGAVACRTRTSRPRPFGKAQK